MKKVRLENAFFVIFVCFVSIRIDMPYTFVKHKQSFWSNILILAAFRRGYMESDGGWINPFNGFEYNLLKTSQSWNYSRILCQEMGGDLATHGIQAWEIRRFEFSLRNKEICKH